MEEQRFNPSVDGVVNKIGRPIPNKTRHGPLPIFSSVDGGFVDESGVLLHPLHTGKTTSDPLAILLLRVVERDISLQKAYTEALNLIISGTKSLEKEDQVALYT